MENITKTVLIPYLNLDGADTGAAMKFYQSIFGGDLVMQTFGEAGMAKTDEEKDFVIHAELKTDTFTFMASSGHADNKVNFGDSVNMSLVGVDTETLTSWFNKLSEGGKIDLPLAKQFWGDIYGQVTDKYGIHWMVNIHNPEAEQAKI